MYKKQGFWDIKISIGSFFIFNLIFIVIGGLIYSQFLKNYNRAEKKDLSLMHEVWNILDEHHLDTREEKKDEITEKDNIYGAIRGLASSYKDPYTVFLESESSKDLKEEISGEFGGVGIEISNKNGYLIVSTPIEKSPAAKAGVLPKDIIIKIDDKDTKDISTSSAAKLIRGKPGTFVSLEIVRKNSIKPIKIKIERALIETPVIKTYNKEKVFVIKLYSFNKNSPKLFFNAVKEFIETKKDRLIIDLRGNPGGHLFASIYIAGLFLPEGTTIVTEDGGHGKKKVFKSGKYHGGNNTTNIFSDSLKLGVLVDGGSASAAEILAGALNNNGKAILLGQNTYGKGTVQQLKNFPNGTSLKYTIAKWILPNGKWISHKGIPVDIEIGITKEEKIEINKESILLKVIDGQLERAIKEMEKIKTKKELSDIIERSKEKIIKDNEEKNREFVEALSN